MASMATPWGALEQRGRVLAEEAIASVRAGRTLDPTWLESAACWLSEDSPPWAKLAGTRPAGREYRLIASSPNLEAWLICWPQGGRLALHDHGGACGALRVVDGTLTEEYVLQRQLPARRRTLAAGTGITFDGDYIHDVANTRGELATSIHVYGSAERPMTHYRLSGAGLVEAFTVTDDAVVSGGMDGATGPASRSPHPAGSRLGRSRTVS